ncbi:hypothetical protein ACW5R3_12050 [Bizionia sp. KMM 8389]
MEKRIISEYNLNLTQKIHMSIILIIGIGIFYITEKVNYPNKDIISLLITILLIVFVVGILTFIVSKKGIIANNKGLFKAYFSFGKLIFKQQIDLNNKPIVSVLKLGKSQNLPSVGIVYPSGKHSFYKFYVYLLNESHTSKTELMDLKKQENAKLIVDFLTKNIDLKSETYSPSFD